MNKLIFRPSWFFLLLFFMPLMSLGQGFQVNLAGAKQISMGGTGTGFVQDGATIFYNPGGMALLKQNSLTAGISPIFLKVGFNGIPPSDYHTRFQTLTPPLQGYAVFGPKNLGLKFGIGIYNPFGGSANWGNNWEGRYALEKLDLKATFIQPSFAFRISPRLGIGGGFVIGLGYVDLTRALPIQDSSGKDGQTELTGHAVGYGYNLGIYYQATDDFSIGVSYRSKVLEKTDHGTALFTVPTSLKASFPSPNTFTNTIPLPATLSVGLAYSPSKPFTLAFDVNFIHWSVYKTLEFDFGTLTPSLQNSISQRNYKDTYDLRLGAQYAFSNRFKLRGGVNYGATSIRDGFVTPETPDADRIGLSAGFGYAFTKHFLVDGSYLFEAAGPRTQTNLETGLAGTFKTTVYIPGIAFTYRF